MRRFQSFHFRRNNSAVNCCFLRLKKNQGCKGATFGIVKRKLIGCASCPEKVAPLLFFRPTPSWLQVDSHKSTGNEPVRSPVCNPSKKTKTQNKPQTKKQANPNKPHKQTQNQQQTNTHRKTSKNKTTKRQPRSGIAQ